MKLVRRLGLQLHSSVTHCLWSLAKQNIIPHSVHNIRIGFNICFWLLFILFYDIHKACCFIFFFDAMNMCSVCSMDELSGGNQLCPSGCLRPLSLCIKCIMQLVSFQYPTALWFKGAYWKNNSLKHKWWLPTVTYHVWLPTLSHNFS